MSDCDGPVGQVAAHVSGDEDGPICAWSFNVGDGRIVYAGEISDRTFALLDDEARAAFGGNSFGWYLICYWPDRSEVWAKCAGDDESRRLVTLIGSMLYAGSLWRAENDKHRDEVAAIRREVDERGADPMVHNLLEIFDAMGIAQAVSDNATSQSD